VEPFRTLRIVANTYFVQDWYEKWDVIGLSEKAKTGVLREEPCSMKLVINQDTADLLPVRMSEHFIVDEPHLPQINLEKYYFDAVSSAVV
jgi:hypothetical protein